MIKIRSEKLIACVLNKGAELCSVKDQAQHEFIWRGVNDIWPRHSPVLFPIVGKLKNGKYHYKGSNYELPQHGFARDMEHALIEQTDSSCSFVLRADVGSLKKYPFQFELKTKYELKEELLRVSYTIRNLDDHEMYFSIGAHPGFALPLLASAKYEDHYLEFETDEIFLSTLEDGLLSTTYKSARLSDRRLILNENVFSNDALILENSQVKALTLGCEGTSRKIRLECKDWPFFGIWSKPGCKEFICLEPWHGITDGSNSEGKLELKKGIMKLGSGNKFHCHYSLSFL